MAVFVGSVVVHVADSARAGEFWTKALDYVPQPDNPEFLRPEEWSPPSTTRVEHGATHVHLDGADRTHLDLWVAEGSDLETEVERLVSLGATRVEWEYAEGADHVVLADPDGTLFCVVG